MAGKIKVTLTAAPSGKSDSFSMSVWAEAAGRVLPARRWRQQRGEEPVAVETVSSQPEYNGTVIKVRVDTVALPDGSRVEREVVDHAGSVAIVTIDDRRSEAGAADSSVPPSGRAAPMGGTCRTA
jgi:hypothetical protein